jgi:hypothetical protein
MRQYNFSVDIRFTSFQTKRVLLPCFGSFEACSCVTSGYSLPWASSWFAFSFFMCSPSDFGASFHFLFLIVPCSCICWASSLAVMVCIFVSCFGLRFLAMHVLNLFFSLSLRKSLLFCKPFLASECSECRAESCFTIYLVQCP